MHHQHPRGSNPRLTRLEPGSRPTHTTEPPSLYTSPPAHVSTPHLFSLSLSLGASVSSIRPCPIISIHTPIHTHQLRPLYIHTIPIFTLQISPLFFFFSVFFGASLVKTAPIDPIFSRSDSVSC